MGSQDRIGQGGRQWFPNSDGNPDVFAETSDGVAVLTGNGDGSFQFARPYRCFDTPLSPALRDLNADGKPEYVYVSNSGADAVTVMPNNSP